MHRAVVDVDVELGLVKVVELAAVQDVGRVMNRLALEGQIHGGTAQGLGLALMEEIQLSDGRVRNPSFTDYLIPTILDMPPMRLEILEHPDPHAPYGLRGRRASRRPLAPPQRSRPLSAPPPGCRCPGSPSAPTTSQVERIICLCNFASIRRSLPTVPHVEEMYR